MIRGLFAGLATPDVVSHVERAPGPDEKVTATWQLLAGGGPALNAAVVFAALGGEATLLSRVGDGPAADLIRADLAGCGVRLVDVARDGTPPVSSITVESDGTRRVVGLDATSAAIDAPDAPDAADDPASEGAMPEVDVVLVDGHHPDLAAAALGHGARLGVPRVLDAGRWKPPMRDLFPGCTHVLASAEFRLEGREESVEARLGRLMRIIGTGSGHRLAGITAGGGDIAWIEREPGGTLVNGRTRPPLVEALDTLGAGDALHGAYAWGLAAGVPDPLEVAATVASRSCETRGTRAWLDRAREFARR